MNLSTESSKDSPSWSNALLLGIQEIDNQHKIFVSLLDKVSSINMEEDNKETILPLLEELQRYSVYHFNSEEALMRKANAPDMDRHIKQHELFKKKCDEFVIAYNYNNKMLVEQMLLFMRKWLIIHISDIDSNYAESVKSYLAIPQ